MENNDKINEQVELEKELLSFFSKLLKYISNQNSKLEDIDQTSTQINKLMQLLNEPQRKQLLNILTLITTNERDISNKLTILESSAQKLNCIDNNINHKIKRKNK